MSADQGYRLRPLRDVRARDEQVRRGDLASAIGDAAALAASVTTADERVRAARGALAAAVTARANVSQVEASRLALAERYISRRRHELAAAQDAHARAVATRDAHRGVVDAARARLVTARADREVIERHFAAWREAKRKAADRAED